MTYRVEPVESYTTDLGCRVVSQVQETQGGVVIEHVALIGPAEDFAEATQLRERTGT